MSRLSRVALALLMQLCNECRCRGEGRAIELQSWISRMAPFVKALAPRQLLGVGGEGFYRPVPGRLDAEHVDALNPSSWYQHEGDDCATIPGRASKTLFAPPITPLHPRPPLNPTRAAGRAAARAAARTVLSAANNSAIDFASYHLHYADWVPDSEPTWQASFIRRFISAHAGHAERLLRKPLLLEEFSAVGTASRSQPSPQSQAPHRMHLDACSTSTRIAHLTEPSLYVRPPHCTCALILVAPPSSAYPCAGDEHYALALRQILASPVHAAIHFWQLTIDDHSAQASGRRAADASSSASRLCCSKKAIVAHRGADANVVALLKHHAAAMRNSAAELPARVMLPSPPSPPPRSPQPPPLPRALPMRLSAALNHAGGKEGSTPRAVDPDDVPGDERGEERGDESAAPLERVVAALKQERDALRTQLRLAQAELSNRCQGDSRSGGGGGGGPSRADSDWETSSPPPLPSPPPPSSTATDGDGGGGESYAALEKSGAPCPVDWGSRRDGARLRSVGETTLSGCCALCRVGSGCVAFNHDSNQGAGRCYLLAESGEMRLVRDAAQHGVYSSAARAEGCSCANIGSWGRTG